MAYNLGSPRIVVIGGGTGSFMLLQSLKELTSNITAVVNMADDGGSTGVLRQELGVLPPGDVRQCLVALSNAPPEIRDLFGHRFPQGSLSGHSFGNLFLSAIESMPGKDFTDSIRLASDFLQVSGKVLPVTLGNCQLVLQKDGEKISGEYRIAHEQLTSRPELSLVPSASVFEDARMAILQADIVVIASGNLYGSVIPALLVDGVAQALMETSAKTVYVCNLVNKSHQTADFAVHDYADEIERFAGKGTLDYVLYNVDLPDDATLARYALEDEYPVLVDREALDAAAYCALPGNFLSRQERVRDAADIRIVRSLIRHDGDAIAAEIRTILAK